MNSHGILKVSCAFIGKILVSFDLLGVEMTNRSRAAGFSCCLKPMLAL